MEKLIEYIIVESYKKFKYVYNQKYIFSKKRKDNNKNRFLILLIDGENNE